MILCKIDIADKANLGGRLEDEGCLLFVQSSRTGPDYFIKIPSVESACIPVYKIVSSTGNIVGQELKSKLTNY